jgi:hypothetical protein
METLGTLTLSMVITVPGYDNARSRTKHVTLARYYYIPYEQAQDLKDRFLKTNDELLPEFVNAKWQVTEHL